MLPGLDDALALIAARAAEHDLDGSFPVEAFDALAATGALRLTIPSDAGGLGGGLDAATRLVTKLGQADPVVALVVSQHLLVHADAGTDRGWSERVLADVRRSSLDGVALINALRVEPELGTPGRGGLPATVAERLPGGRGWRIRGHKIYSTGIPLLRWLLVWARTDDPEPLQGSFVVEAGTPGYSVEETWDTLGMRATRSDDVIFDRLVVGPRSCRRARRRAGSVAQRADVERRAHRRRVPRRGPVGPRLAARLPPRADPFEPRSAAGHVAALPGGGRPDRGVARDERCRARPGRRVGPRRTRRPPREAALAKYTVTNHAVEVVLAATALVGNPGLLRRNPLERHLRNVLHGRIHSPQDDVILGGAGRAALATP